MVKIPDFTFQMRINVANCFNTKMLTRKMKSTGGLLTSEMGNTKLTIKRKADYYYYMSHVIAVVKTTTNEEKKEKMRELKLRAFEKRELRKIRLFPNKGAGRLTPDAPSSYIYIFNRIRRTACIFLLSAFLAYIFSTERTGEML